MTVCTFLANQEGRHTGMQGSCHRSRLCKYFGTLLCNMHLQVADPSLPIGMTEIGTTTQLLDQDDWSICPSNHAPPFHRWPTPPCPSA